ncbi:MAG: hypothetical protein ABSF71_38540 [Terriglobia bacterium]|jgi:hypothetical protein
MKLLILAMLLTISEAPAPIPGKATDNPTFAGHSSERKTANSQRQSTPPPVPLHLPPKVEQNSGQPEGNANAQKATVIREPLTEDWWNRTYVIATVALVLVGAIGIWFAGRTLLSGRGLLPLQL